VPIQFPRKFIVGKQTPAIYAIPRRIWSPQLWRFRTYYATDIAEYLMAFSAAAKPNSGSWSNPNKQGKHLHG